MNVTIRHLEMTDPAQLVAPSRAVRGLTLREQTPADPALVRRFYLSVGERFHWVDRRDWSLAEWEAWAGAATLTSFVAAVDGREAGFAVLDIPPDGEVELAYFGLLGEFIGRGFGSAFLYETTRRAFELGACRVRLHTCSMDHPSALPGYLARGYRVYRIVEEERDGDGRVRG